MTLGLFTFLNDKQTSRIKALTSTLHVDSWKGGRRSQYIWPVQNTLTKQKFSNKHSPNRWLDINAHKTDGQLSQKKILTIKMAKTRRSELRWLGLSAHNKDGQDQLLTMQMARTSCSQCRWPGLGAHNKIGQDQALTIKMARTKGSQ